MPTHAQLSNIAIIEKAHRTDSINPNIRQQLTAIVLVVPLLAFLTVCFLFPIAQALFRSVDNPEVSEILPNIAREIQVWDGQGLPPSNVVKIFVSDIEVARDSGQLPRAAKRLNYLISGYRALLLKTARQLPPSDDPALLNRLIDIDQRWGERGYWTALKQASPAYTLTYLLAALDLEYNADQEIVRVPSEYAIYVDVLLRTLWISVTVTLLTLFLGYPIAYLLASIPTKYSNILILFLLLPFWTSVLVRTTAWLVLLQDTGVVNNLGIWIGLWKEPLELVRNRLGIYIAMTHILLPFMVLPIFSVMKGVSPYHLKAAASLGAKPLRAFAKVYIPQTIPGVAAGVLLVFILSLGYYITPALVGGPKDQMLSYFIAFNVNMTVNWGMAAALSVILLSCVAVFLVIFSRYLNPRTLGVS